MGGAASVKKQKRTRPREASIKKPEIGGETWKVFTNPKTQIKHKGKSKRSTEYAFWRIETDNKRVCILTLEHDLVWGNRKLYVNGEVGFDSGWKFKLVGDVPLADMKKAGIPLESIPKYMGGKGDDPIGYHYKLNVPAASCSSLKTYVNPLLFFS